jgi:putative membrane-bound dehydrogenase-like protein
MQFRILAPWLAALLVHASPGSGASPDSPPLSPAESQATIRVPAGYTVELIAAEPLVLDPVAFDWDHQGRLWVVEMADYPLGLDDSGASGGRIRVLQDRNGDGAYDHSTLFADGLNFPNGLITWRGGVIVTAAPDILYLEDTTGDGKADKKEVLYTGLTEGNQQLRANGLRWGLDNWIYVAAGGHHGRHGADTKLLSTRTGRETVIGSRDFRIRPDTGEVEPQSGPSQFGRNRDNWGRWFGTQNSHPLWHYVLPDHYLRRNPHLATGDGRVQLPGGSNPPVYPAKVPEKRYHSFQQSGRYTSACAGMIYRDRLLFRYDQTIAFICEPFHNLVQGLRLEDDGVTFRAERIGAGEEPDFFASTDRWCRPVMTRTGPDGALWVADMYRYMIEHPQFLPPEGKEELLPHYRLGDDKGRIYRIVKKNAPARPLPKLDPADFPALSDALESENGWLRDKAQQMILWGVGTHFTVEDTHGWLNPLLPDRAHSRLHRLCTLDGLGLITPLVLVKALADQPAPGIRENALRIAEASTDPEVIAAACALIDDPDPKVRLQLAFSLGAWDTPEAGRALATLLRDNQDDGMIVTACLSSALPHLDSLTDDMDDATRALLLPIAVGAGRRDALAAILAPSLGDSTDPGARWMLWTMLFRHLDASGLESLTAGGEDDALPRILESAPAVFAEAAARLDDPSADIESRTLAALLLKQQAGTRGLALAFFVQSLDTEKNSSHWASLLRGFADLTEGDLAFSSTVLGMWPALTPGQRNNVLETLASRPSWTRSLLEAVGSGAVKPAEIDPTRRLALLRHSDKTLRERAAALLETTGTSNRAVVVEKHLPALELPADVTRGHAVYQRACASCHQHGEEGLAIGPHLSSVAAHEPEKILANILDPNLDIQPGYHAYIATLRSGEQLFGMLAGESGASLTFKLPDATTRVLRRSDIQEIKSTGVSLMPDGLESILTEQDLADLIAFLRQP